MPSQTQDVLDTGQTSSSYQKEKDMG